MKQNCITATLGGFRSAVVCLLNPCGDYRGFFDDPFLWIWIIIEVTTTHWVWVLETSKLVEF